MRRARNMEDGVNQHYELVEVRWLVCTERWLDGDNGDFGFDEYIYEPNARDHLPLTVGPPKPLYDVVRLDQISRRVNMLPKLDALGQQVVYRGELLPAANRAEGAGVMFLNTDIDLRLALG